MQKKSMIFQKKVYFCTFYQNEINYKIYKQ